MTHQTSRKTKAKNHIHHINQTNYSSDNNGDDMREGWEYKRLGDVCQTAAGGTPLKSKKEYYQGGKIPWLLSGEVSQGEIFKALNFITEEGLKNSSAKLFPKNTVLVAMYGATAGQVGILRFEASTNQAVCGILPNKIFIPEFLFYYFLRKKEELVSQAIGNAQPNISQEKIRNTLVPILSLSEQKRIVEILDEAFAAIDKAKANVEKNLQNAKELFECYLQNVFDNKGNDWEEKTIGDVVESVEYGSSSKSKSQGKVPVLRMGNIQNRRFDWSDLVFTDNEEEIKKYQLKYNDVLFNRTNSAELVGKTAIYKGEQPAIFAGYLIRLNRKEDLIDGDFLNYYLNSKKVRQYGFSVMTSSVNQANINGSKLKEYPIVVPPMKTQRLIVSHLDNLLDRTNKLENIYSEKLNVLEELKKSILQKAFTGELTAKEVVL